MRLSDSLCRLTVQRGGDDAQGAVDLALPSNTLLGRLMPSIVEIVHRDGSTPLTGCRWQLSRIGGSPLDESRTLADNEIRDGALLLLTANDPPALEWLIDDPTHIVAQANTASPTPAPRMFPVIGCLSMAGVGAAALGWPAVVAGTAGQPVTGAGLAIAAATGAVLVRRTHPDPLLSVTLGIIAITFAALAGYLVVPAGQPAAQALLAAAAAFWVAILLRRLMTGGTICLTAIAAAAMLIAGVAAGSVVWDLSTAAAGALLATLSLATLALGPRFSIAVAGIGPRPPSVDDGDGPAPHVINARAVMAHQTLTGLVIGSSGTAALGAALVACTGHRDHGSPLSAAIFTAVIGPVLLLQVRTHVDATRRTALAMGGMISVAACFALAIASWPQHAHWISVLAAATGIATLCPRLGLSVSPVTRRAVELGEYLALAAVVPVACWAGGLYGLVRNMGLL